LGRAPAVAAVEGGQTRLEQNDVSPAARAQTAQSPEPQRGNAVCREKLPVHRDGSKAVTHESLTTHRLSVNRNWVTTLPPSAPPRRRRPGRLGDCPPAGNGHTVTEAVPADGFRTLGASQSVCPERMEPWAERQGSGAAARAATGGWKPVTGGWQPVTGGWKPVSVAMLAVANQALWGGGGD